MIFNATAKGSSGIQTSWSAQVETFSEKLTLAIPPEFNGPGNGLSPEDLYNMALQNCFAATFKVFAEKSRLQFSEFHLNSRLEVDRNEKGQVCMARFHLKVQLSGVVQKDSALRLLERTKTNCMILNSVLTEKTFEFEVLEGAL